ncbi:hypothetical protein KCH_66040 [Kitasatospora cheerisanensis KCTC 2395]|uniref:Uncharacterized protein n=1 Tax=Kitasatospora cheerisanensis KCTC 2395 TaxID=1348663 RepID=A0A066YKH0_9ACTN|nr:hypothetical protein KCH_66040 [Kitasatospora cheerisanensis KCTC 2395]
MRQLDPGVELFAGRVLGQFRGEGASGAREGGVVAEGGVEELLDQSAAFGLGQPGQSVHACGLLGGGSAPGDRGQHGPSQAQGADLYVECGGVSRGDLGEREFAVHDLADGGQAEAEFAQRPHQLQACDGLGAVPAVARRGAADRRDQAPVGVEPDGLDREAGVPGQVADRVQRVAFHAAILGSPPVGGSSPGRDGHSVDSSASYPPSTS